METRYTVGTVGCRILSNPTVTVLYLVSLLFGPPILHVHPTAVHFLDREVFKKYTCMLSKCIDNTGL